MNKEQEETSVSPTKNTNKNNTSTSIETLNPESSGSSITPVPEDGDEELPTLLPSMQAFAKLPSCIPALPLTATTLPPTFNPVRDIKSESFDVALNHLSKNKELLREETGATDALLVEAFQAQMRGEGHLARRCVEKGLLIQYCNKLGSDGVNLFFRR